MRILILAVAGAALGPVPPEAEERPGNDVVIVGRIEGAITPVTVEYVDGVIAAARDREAKAIVLTLNTPGGGLPATESIIQSILRSIPPVVVFISPPGAVAGSAGLYIANACDVIAMASGTRIGAGHPVTSTGGNPGGEENKGRNYLGEKIENDAAASVRSIAAQRGRNAAVYERMVRESISLTEREAVDQKVADLVARDLDDLLSQIEGREIARFDGSRQRLELARARLERIEPTGRQRLLGWLANPQLAFVLLSVGLLGLYAEFNHPGLILPGVVGAAALVLFAMSMQILPINVVGLLLIALAVILFILEIKVTSYGMLTLGGLVSLVLGFVTLYDIREMPGISVPLSFIMPTAITLGLLMAGVTWLAVRAQRLRVATGMESLPGTLGQAITDISTGAGKVFVHGEYWDATSSESIPRGARVRITAVRRMGVEVERALD